MLKIPIRLLFYDPLVYMPCRLGGEPRNRAVAHIVAAGNLAHRLAALAARKRLALLMRGQLGCAAELDAARLGARPAFAGAGAYQLPLELGQAAENGQHQAAVRCRGVG